MDDDQEYVQEIAVRVYGSLSAPKKEGDAGHDIAAVHPCTLFAGQSRLIMTDVQVEMPDDMCALVVPRSSLNAIGIFCQVGLIDSGYRGQIGVVLYNKTASPYSVESGQRIAQLLFLPYYTPTLMRVETPDQLAPSQRAQSGFGSTNPEAT